MPYGTLSLPKTKRTTAPPKPWQNQPQSRQQALDEAKESIPEWVTDYLDIPFQENGRDRSGLDCWGLARLVLAEQYHVKVPTYLGDYESVLDSTNISQLIKSSLGFWRPVYPPMPGDCVLCRLRKQPGHIGIVVAPGWMLHVLHGRLVTLDTYDSLQWQRKLIGFYRYQAKLFDEQSELPTTYHMR